MKKLLLSLIMILMSSVLAADISEYELSPHNLKISDEIESRIIDGLHFGVNRLGEECSVEIKGTSIQIKSANFQENLEEEESCSQKENIACFKFTPLIHIPSKGILTTGDLFKVNIRAQSESLLHLHTVRKIGGTAEYLLLIDNHDGQTSIKVTEVRDDMLRKLDCSIDM